MHITHELLLAVREGRFPREEFEDLLLEHLMALCPTCCHEIHQFDWALYRQEAPDRLAYQPHFENAVERARMSERAHSKALKEAKPWLRELRTLRPEERRGKVERAIKRFRGEVFADLLVEEARRHLPGNPWQSYSFADAAFAAIYHTPGLRTESSVEVRSIAYRANAQRAMGRLLEADTDMRLARRLLNEKDVTDVSVYAELDSLEGSLRKDQRRLARAAKLFHRSVLFWTFLGQAEDAARNQVTLALVLFDQDELQEAVGILENALQVIDGDDNRCLVLFARLNLARTLEALGKPDDAAEILSEDEKAQEEHFALLQKLRVDWLLGKIEKSRGSFKKARTYLDRARNGFIDAGVGYDVAMVSLDLALVLLELGETTEVQRIAREAHRLFDAQGVHPDALVALQLFKEAAVAERLTAEAINRSVRILRQANRRPLPQETPS